MVLFKKRKGVSPLRSSETVPRSFVDTFWSAIWDEQGLLLRFLRRGFPVGP